MGWGEEIKPSVAKEPGWTQALMDRHRDVLNRLEPHLGCVTCKGKLVDDGICPTCDPCSCGGVRWVEDEGWSPDGWKIRARIERTPGDGLIPCGFCNHGGWDIDPMPPYEER